MLFLKVNCNSEILNNEDILNNIDKYAKEFSEENENLEKVLKLLWNDGFETVGCCGDNSNTSYIGFKVVDINKLIRLFSSINKSDVRIAIVKNASSFTCSIKKYKNEDIFLNILNNYNKNLVDNDIKRLFEKFNDYKGIEYINSQYYYFDNNLYKYFNTSDLDIVNDFKDKYEYKVLNEALHLYSFKIT